MRRHRSIKCRVEDCFGKDKTRREICHVIVRLVREGTLIAKQIDEAFESHPFIPELPPTHPKNQRRFYLYLSLLAQAFDSISIACKLFDRIYGDHDFLITALVGSLP